MKLQALNLIRWVREYIISWGLLSFIYSITVTLILQPLLEQAFKRDIPAVPLWALICGLLLVPGALEILPLPPLTPVVRRGFFSFGRPLVRLYLRHDLRRGGTWLTVVAVVIIGQLLPERLAALWILAALLPVQRALYSIHRWRGITLSFYPESGARALIIALASSQTIQLAVAWLALGLSGAWAPALWLKLGAAGLGGVLSASAVAMEGDSGRPWLVNFFSLAAGILGGYLSFATPWTLLAVGYFCNYSLGAVRQRLRSVEHLDEDTLIP